MQHTFWAASTANPRLAAREPINLEACRGKSDSGMREAALEAHAIGMGRRAIGPEGACWCGA
jgi:hypothetical protein